MATLFASADFLEAVEIVRQYGPFAGLLIIAVIFYMWRDWKREAALCKRVALLEDYARDTLVPLVTNVTSVVAKNTTVMERLEKYLEK